MKQAKIYYLDSLEEVRRNGRTILHEPIEKLFIIESIRKAQIEALRELSNRFNSMNGKTVTEHVNDIIEEFKL